jgi:hypothetical protein
MLDVNDIRIQSSFIRFAANAWACNLKRELDREN